METSKHKRRPGSAQISKVKRRGVDYCGYDVSIRQPGGTRRRYRDFVFGTRSEAQAALAAVRTIGWKARYGLAPTPKSTTIKEAVESYFNVAKATLLANRNDEITYWRAVPGHLRTTAAASNA